MGIGMSEDEGGEGEAFRRLGRNESYVKIRHRRKNITGVMRVVSPVMGRKEGFTAII